MATIEVFLFVFGVGDDVQNEVLGIDVIVDDTGAAPLAPALGGSTQFAETASTGNQIARVRIHSEVHFQIQDVHLRQEAGGGLLKSGKSNEFQGEECAIGVTCQGASEADVGAPASGGPTVCEGRGVALREERRVMDRRGAFQSGLAVFC